MLSPARGGIQNRRRFLQSTGAFAGAAVALPAWADSFVDLRLPGGPSRRELTTAFPQKGQMILQRTRPPLLETPFEVFDQGVFTPNDRFYVRWHLANIPTRIDPADFTLKVRGHVGRPLALGLDALVHDVEPVAIAAVNQ